MHQSEFSQTTSTMEYELNVSKIVLYLFRAIFFFVAPLVFLLFKTRKDPRIYKILSEFNGPLSLPVVGAAYTLARGGLAGIFNTICHKFIQDYGRLIRTWYFNYPQVLIASAKDAEKVLHAVQHNAKSQKYNIMSPLFGRGLITSKDSRWKAHRKILVPAFNSNILHEFLIIFNKNAKILSNKLKSISDDEKEFNVLNPVTLCALDIINESSMGATINAQLEENSPYVTAVRSIIGYFIQVYFSPWLLVPLIYRFSSLKQKISKHLRIINNLTDQVIAQRRQYLQSIKKVADESSTIDKMEDDFGGKRKNVVFIDAILMAEKDGRQIMTDRDIRDEVKTFMVAGHETVATTMGWSLFLIGTYPEVQKKVVEELIQVFGDTGREPTMSDLSELKYLERCILETLRLYPSIPFFERAIREDIKLDCGRVIPAGCTASILAYSIQRDPEHFPDPEKFDPDRFLPENTKKRHPYSYLAFSAGPRNCIGRKYALVEAKALISTVMRRFRVEAAQFRSEVVLEMGAVLQPQGGLKIRVFERESTPNLQLAS